MIKRIRIDFVNLGMEAPVHTCKQCGKPINTAVGRRDRLFCNEACKNKFHNIQAYQEAQEIKRIQHILKKNRRILKKLFEGKDNEKIPKEKILKLGFEFDFHTHFIITKMKGYQYHFCFDYGYRNTHQDFYKIIQAFNSPVE